MRCRCRCKFCSQRNYFLCQYQWHKLGMFPGIPWSSLEMLDSKATPPHSSHPSTLQLSSQSRTGFSSNSPFHPGPRDAYHPKSLLCEYCDASFSSSNGLRGHINKVHLNYTPYTCEICGKGFNFKRHYEGHMNTHNNVKAFKCTDCACQFTYKASLWRHTRDKHSGASVWIPTPACLLHVCSLMLLVLPCCAFICGNKITLVKWFCNQ